MSASSTPDNVGKPNWFTRTLSIKNARAGQPSTISRLTSVSNPGFVSFSEILRPRRPPETQPKPPADNIADSLVDIAVNAGSDVSSLVDRSKGTTDFFRDSPVRTRHFTVQQASDECLPRVRCKHRTPATIQIGLRSIGSAIKRETVSDIRSSLNSDMHPCGSVSLPTMMRSPDGSLVCSIHPLVSTRAF